MSQDKIRDMMRDARAKLGQEIQSSASTQLLQNIQSLNIIQPSQHVCSYLAVRGEISLNPTFDWMQTLACQLYLPVLNGFEMKFAKWQPGDNLLKKPLGLLEPDVKSEELSFGMEADIILVPLVAFDPKCHRVGQGGGYYDRAFEARGKNPELTSPVLIGVAHEMQKVDEIQTNLWDVPLDYVVTDKNIYKR